MLSTTSSFYFTEFHWSNVASLLSSLCCTCGVPIPPNPANMCVACLRTQVDISEGIPKQVTVHFCKQCERFVFKHRSIILFFPNMVHRSYHCSSLENISRYKMLSWVILLVKVRLECTSSSFMQILTATSHLGAVCLGVQGTLGPLPEKNQELYDQSKFDPSKKDSSIIAVRHKKHTWTLQV